MNQMPEHVEDTPFAGFRVLDPRIGETAQHGFEGVRIPAQDLNRETKFGYVHANSLGQKYSRRTVCEDFATVGRTVLLSARDESFQIPGFRRRPKQRVPRQTAKRDRSVVSE